MYQFGHPRYESLRGAAVWNGVVPERYPDAIARPATPDEVAPLVAQAHRRGSRVAVRSGGHNWLGAFLRNGGLLLDLGDLDGVEVDVERRVATVEPGATHRVLADAIAPHGLGFPIGHCPTVGLGGYLLAGGYGWNPRTWGPACWSVEALDVVDVRGRELRVSESEHPDLHWAARGGGGGFPAIATRYRLRLQPLPRIASIRSDYPLDLLPELLPWSAGLEAMPPGTEISLVAHRPLDAGGGARLEPRATVQASGFAEAPEEALALARAAADGAPVAAARVDERTLHEVRLNDLEGEGAWVEGLRYAVDMCWIEAGYAEVGAICARAVREAPSAKSRIVLAWGFAPPDGPDVAQTALGTLTVNLYAIWDDPGDDAENAAWIRSVVDLLEPWITGFYAGESDLAVSADRPRRCYPAEKWRRLGEIRDRYDPGRRKHGFLGES